MPLCRKLQTKDTTATRKTNNNSNNKNINSNSPNNNNNNGINKTSEKATVVYARLVDTRQLNDFLNAQFI